MRPEKVQLVQDLQGLLSSSAGLFLVSYKGLTVSDFAELRGRLAEVDAECHVVPNRLLLRAAAENGLETLAASALADDTAMVSGGQDATEVAKALRGFARQHKEVSFKAGVFEGKLYSREDTARLAELPPREVVLAQLLGLLQAPMGQLVGVLNAKVASIVYVLRAYADSKESGQQTEPAVEDV